MNDFLPKDDKDADTPTPIPTSGVQPIPQAGRPRECREVREVRRLLRRIMGRSEKVQVSIDLVNELKSINGWKEPT